MCTKIEKCELAGCIYEKVGEKPVYAESIGEIN